MNQQDWKDASNKALVWMSEHGKVTAVVLALLAGLIVGKCVF